MYLEEFRWSPDGLGFVGGPFETSILAELAVREKAAGTLFYVLCRRTGLCWHFDVSEQPLYDYWKQGNLSLVDFDRMPNYNIWIRESYYLQWGKPGDSKNPPLSCRDQITGQSMYASRFRKVMLLGMKAVYENTDTMQKAADFLKPYAGKDLNTINFTVMP